MNKKTTKILLIEDDPDDVLLINDMLKESFGNTFKIIHKDKLQDGFKLIENEHVDIVLLDLTLPDSDSEMTLEKAHQIASDLPVVVLTGLDDDSKAILAMQRGPQDYLVKRKVSGELLSRSIRYAIERHKLISELDLIRQAETQQREFKSYEQLSQHPLKGMTAKSFGLLPLSKVEPVVYQELIQKYKEVLENALEKQIFKIEYNTSAFLREIAEQIGLINGGPRDAIEIHSSALKATIKDKHPRRAQAYLEEARLMILEMMGYLVTYYRNYSMGIKNGDE